jgi:hypothetical protein
MPFCIRVTGRAGQVADHVELDFLRRVEAERGQVADVELDDVVAFFLHLSGLFEDRAADVVADAVQLVGFAHRFHGVCLSRPLPAGSRPSFLNMSRMPRTACRVRSSFSISAKRT